MNTRPPTLRPLGLTGLLASAVWVLSGCAGPYPNERYEPVASQPYPQSYPQTYPYGTQGSDRRNYQRRANERLFEARVMSVRAVMVAGNQRCWMEREAVPQPRSGANLPGALAGAVIGGVLGHQVGGGSGRDLATVGGVVAGAAIGSNIGRDRFGNPVAQQDVQRCTSDPARRTADYWDVTYQFRGITHRAQMTAAPGRTITVNSVGEPRI